MVHSHPLSSVDYPLYSQKRQLDENELAKVNTILDLKPSNKNFRHYVKSVFNKSLTSQDVVNMRNKLAAEITGTKISDLDMLQSVLDDMKETGGKSVVESKANGSVELICFASADVLRVGQAYPEVLFMDGTYKVNKYDFSLYQIMVQDGSGHGRCIMYSFLSAETQDLLRRMLSIFVTMFTGSLLKTSVIFVDKDFKEIDAIKDSILLS